MSDIERQRYNASGPALIQGPVSNTIRYRRQIVYPTAAAARCHSLSHNAEAGYARGWTLPPECVRQVARYMENSREAFYETDFAGVIESARGALEGLGGARWRSDLLVLDVDETALLNLGYYRYRSYGAGGRRGPGWAAWVEAARAPPAVPTLQLYRDLQAANWSVAFVTGRPEQPHEANETALAYKSRARKGLEKSGYRILGVIGDQWSDLEGPHRGNLTFKLPNPMYYFA
eukprot:jgi/Mesen1/8412/ME000471S07731